MEKRFVFASALAAMTALSAFATPRKAVDFTVSGYTGASPLANFPVLVRISPERIPGFSYADCAADGAGIAFEDAQGNVLDREIDTWDTAGESLVWVRVPSLVSNEVITMTYTDPSVTAQPACQTNGAVWASAGYAGVWHMNEASGAVADATGHGLDATPAGSVANSIAYADGVVGTARQTATSASRGYLSVPSYDSLSLGNTFTMSGWIYFTGVSGYPRLFSRKKSYGDANGWEIEMKSGSYTGFTARGAGNGSTVGGTIPTLQDSWVHLAFVYSGTTVTAYANGEEVATGTIQAATDNGFPLSFGCDSDGNESYVRGYFDECRLLGAVASADWVKASYATQSDSSFLTCAPAHFHISDDMLTVAGVPEEFGSPTPAYGRITGLAANAPLSISMAATAVPGEGTITNFLKGWTLESVNVETAERTFVRSSASAGESTDRCAYVHNGCAVFTWEWDVRDALGVGAPVVTENGGSSLAFSIDVTGIGYTAPSATLKLVYGVAPDALAYTNVVSASVTDIGQIDTTLSRLSPGVTYYLKAVLETNDGRHDIAESALVAVKADGLERIPPGYTPVEYIEGSAAPYIDTGYMPSPLTRMVVDYQITQKVNQYRVFGVQNTDLVYNLYINGSGKWAYGFQNDSGNWVDTGVDADANRHLFDFNFKTSNGKRGLTIDGGSVVNTTLSGSPTKTARLSVFLGADHTSSGPVNIAKFRVFSYKIYEDETLVRDFVPVRRDFDSVYGLYDAVTGAFLVNSGSGNFTAGRDISIQAREVIENGALASVALYFPSTASSRNLRMVWGPTYGGDDPAEWAFNEAVAAVAAGETNRVCSVPANWGGDSNLVVRYYFDGTPTEWSNAIFWHDYAAPTVTDMGLDGTGGDTLTVSGTLASFPGDDCVLSVFVGDGPTSLDRAWTGLAGATRTATGAFTLTLFEPDTASARYLTPGATYYVAIQASSGGQVTRTAPVAVTMSAAPVFASATSAVARRTVTFTGRLSDVGEGSSATVTLYAGAESDAEEDLVAIEPSATIASTDSFTFTHTFPAFETTYKWQFRAVAVSAGETSTLTTRTDVATCLTRDTTDYTWRTSVMSGNWSDPANWTDNKDGDCLGYPQSTAANANFSSMAKATVSLTEALSIGTLGLHQADIEITFVQGGASTNATKLTATTLNFNGARGVLAFDGVAVSSGGNTTLGAFRSLTLRNGANLYMGNLDCQETNDVTVAGGSWLSCNEMHFGGGTITVDDSTLWTRWHDIVGRNRVGGHIVFKGAHPFWHHNNKDGYFYSAIANANVQLDFIVPAGGFAEAPIRAVGTQVYYMGNDKTSNGSCALTVNVLDESPANYADGTATHPLIAWPKGINKAMVLEGHLPQEGGAATDDAFAWGDGDYPTTLSVTISGHSHAAQLQIAGVPEEIAAPYISPAYGYHSFSSNATATCAVTAETIPISNTKRAICKGWKLYSVNPATLERVLVDSGDGASCTVTGTGGWLVLEWQWRVEYPVTAVAGSGGAVEPASQWVEAGTWAAVSAVPDATHGFVKWSGDVPEGALATDSDLGFFVDGPMELSASFGRVWFVSTRGDGTAPSAGYATGYQTIAAALSAATAGDTIRVESGMYSLDDTVNLNKGVKVVGDDRDSTILYKTGTAVVSYRLVNLNHAEAVLRGVTISNGYANIIASGVYIDTNGGSLIDCRVQKCSSKKWDPHGAAVYVNSTKGVISRCILEDNFCDSNTHAEGTGAYMANGLIENSLVVGCHRNSGSNPGAGLYLAGTSVARNCTVVRNTSNGNGGGIYCGGTARVINCAIYDNIAPGDTSAGAPDWYGPSANFVNCAAPVAPGASSHGGDGGFVAPASLDYRLLAGSALRNAGVAAVAAVGAFDLNGSPRVSGDAIDIGCYEYDESTASVGLSVSPEALFAGGTAVFTPALVGVADNAPRTWTITDEHGVATVLPASCESGVALSAPGLYTVRLDVAVPGGQTLSAERAAYLYVGPRAIYADIASANPQSPYATPATAATDINDAVRYANLLPGSEVVVADGLYPLTGELALECPVTLRSVNGPEKTILKRFGARESGTLFRVLFINDPQAKASGFTLTGGSVNVGSGGGCYIGPYGGELSDCIVSNNYVFTYDASGGGIYMNSYLAHVDRCFITDNMNKKNGAYCYGAGVRQAGGLLENCLITGNWTQHRGGGVYISGTSKMYNCTVYGNTAYGQTGGGIHVDGVACLVRNCAAYGNTADNDTAEGAPDISANGGSVCANCAFPKTVGSLAAIADPAFTDPVNGDFTVQSSSPLRNGGTALADLGALDLAGDARVQGAAPDIGCYEYDESQRAVSFSASPTVGFAGGTFVFTPTIEGFGADATHTWKLTDEDGHVTTFDAASEAAYVVATDGLYTVTLTVTDNGVDTVVTRDDYLRVVLRKYEVTTAEGLRHAVEQASYIDGIEIEVADGVYDLTGTIELTTATTFHSANGPTNAVLRRTFGRDHAPLFRILYINDPNAKVSGFTITGGSTDVAHGGGVLIGPRGGELTWSIVSNNWVKTYDSSGGGIHMNSSLAHVDRCVVTCNTNAHTGSSYCYGGGVRVSGGLLENSLITHNWTDHRGGGVYIDGSGKMLNCTVYGNTANKQQGGGICGKDSSFTVANCASYGNVALQDATAGGPDVGYDIRSAENYSRYANCAFPKAVGSLEAIPDPLFTDAAGGDFTLQTGSPLIDAGAAIADLGPLDLAGNDRAYGETAPDIGCLEYQPGAVGLNFTVSPAVGFPGDTYTFTPTVEGFDGAIAKYWTITDAAGVSTDLPATCEEGVVLSAYGTYDVTLTVVAGGRTYTLTREDLFHIAPRDLFVDAASATPQAPYATRATAATNVIDAVAEAIDGSTVHVAPGDYEQPATIVLDADIAVVSDAGAATTTLRRTFGTAQPLFGIVLMNAPGALVKGFTITGGREANYGGCRIQSRGGTLEDCIVEGNASSGSWADYPGGILASSSAARIRRCIIRNNTMATSGTYFGAGANISAGRIENCLIVGNRSSNANSSSGGGLRLGGTAWNCTIVSNFSNRAEAGILLTGDGRAVNCAILGNVGREGAENPDWSAPMRDYLTYCASPVRTGEGYLIMTFDESCFRNPAAGDYRIRNRSPLVNAGSDLSYGAADVDLAGNQRIFEMGVNRHAACDIGCYEAAFNPGGGTMIILK